MPKNTALDDLIRQVDTRKTPHNSADELIVPIVTNTSRTFLGRSQVSYFLIRKYRGSECGATLSEPIIDFSADWRLDLAIDYRVRMADCPFDGFARKLAEQLFDPMGPQQKLENLIKEWLHHFESQIGGPHEFILDFEAQKPRAVEAIRRWALDLLSLELKIGINLASSKAVKQTEEVSSFSTKVVFKDNDRPVDLKVQALQLDLDRDPRKAILAHVRNADLPRLQDELERRLREIITSDVRLQDMRPGSAARTKQALRDNLNSVAGKFGRCIRVLDLTCQTPLLDPKWESPKLQPSIFDVSVPEYPSDVKVTARLSLELADLGTFATVFGGSPDDLQTWVNQMSQTVIGPRLSRHRYVELAGLWENELRLISEELRQKAQTIGFKLIHVNIETELPFDKVRRPFEITMNEPVITRHSEFKITVDIKATIRIDSFETLASKYPAEMNIEERVKESIRVVLASVGKEYSPKEWYLNFDVPAETENGTGKKALKIELAERIQYALRAEFGGTVLAVAITRDGQLLKLLKDLREATPPLKVLVTRQPFKTDLAYRVTDVSENYWHRFEATKPTIADLNERITLHIQQQFADEDPAVFLRRSNLDCLRLLNEGKKQNGVPWMIEEQYGLKIYIDHWIRDISTVERQRDQLREDAERVIFEEKQRLVMTHSEEVERDLVLKQELKAQLRDKIKVLHPFDDADEIAGLTERLNQLNREIKQQSSETLLSILATGSMEVEKQLSASLGQTAKALNSGQDQPEQADAKSA